MTQIDSIARWGYNIEELDELDSWGEVWKECKDKGIVWGGRSRGGRGVRVNTGQTRDISVEGVELRFSGKVLLESSR